MIFLYLHADKNTTSICTGMLELVLVLRSDLLSGIGSQHHGEKIVNDVCGCYARYFGCCEQDWDNSAYQGQGSEVVGRKGLP